MDPLGEWDEANNVRVVIVQPDRFCRELLTDLVEKGAGAQVVRAVGTGREAVEAVRATRPNLVLTEVELPDMDGMLAIRQVLAGEDPPTVVVLAKTAPPQRVEEAVSLGVAGFVLRSAGHAELLEAIRAAMAHETYIRVPQPRRAGERAGLRSRDVEILRRLSLGERPDLIAHALGLSGRTLRNELSRIYDRLGVHDRLGAIAEARRQGYLL